MKSYFKFLSRNKAYAAIDVFGLAISMMFVMLIGCYTWQETHVDKQHSKADRMYWLGLDFGGNTSLGTHWYLQFMLKDKFPEIENSTAIYRNKRWISQDKREILTNCYFVDSTFFEIFDFRLIQGDPKTVLDDPTHIVVTPEYARKVWGDGDPIGKSILFNDNEPPFIVAGVMEPMKNTAMMTQEKQPVDMLLNFNMVKYANRSLIDPGLGNATGSQVLLLAKEGHDLTSRAKDYENALRDAYWILQTPEDNAHLKIIPSNEAYFLQSESGQMNSGDIRMIWLLFGIGVVILLFSIMNYINLTVALSGKRAKEMATRRLLGEGRMEIMWRLIGESTILCAFSMAIGIALSFLMAPYASSLLQTPIEILSCLNVTTIGFLIAVLLIMSLASGIIPAFMLSSMKPIEAVKGAFRKKSKMIFGKVFILLQNVATITMVACAMTMYLQVKHMINAPLGYEYEGLLEFQYQYFNNDNGKFKDEAMKLPFVESVSYCCGTPHDRGNNNTVRYLDKTISFQIFIGDEEYFDIFDFQLTKDHHVASDWKIFVNQQAISEMGVEEDAGRFPFGDEWPPIAGIVKDFKIGNILTDQHPVYICKGKAFEHFYPWSIIVKVNGDEHEAILQLKNLYEELYGTDYSDFVFDNPSISHQIEKDFEDQTRLSIILAIFATIAILISMLGLTAMSTYYVRQRSQDIAVHKVMGGTSAEVLTQLVRTFMIYVVIAALISIPIIYYVMNDWLSQFSYRIPVYWWIYAASALLAIIICFVSVIIQCRRAANTNPINSLK